MARICQVRHRTLIQETKMATRSVRILFPSVATYLWREQTLPQKQRCSTWNKGSTTRYNGPDQACVMRIASISARTVVFVHVAVLYVFSHPADATNHMLGPVRSVTSCVLNHMDYVF